MIKQIMTIEGNLCCDGSCGSEEEAPNSESEQGFFLQSEENII